MVDDDGSTLGVESDGTRMWLVYSRAQPATLRQLQDRAVMGCSGADFSWRSTPMRLRHKAVQVRIDMDSPWLPIDSKRLREPIMDVEADPRWVGDGLAVVGVARLAIGGGPFGDGDRVEVHVVAALVRPVVRVPVVGLMSGLEASEFRCRSADPQVSWSERPASRRDHWAMGRPFVRQTSGFLASAQGWGQPSGESSHASWRP